MKRALLAAAVFSFLIATFFFVAPSAFAADTLSNPNNTILPGLNTQPGDLGPSNGGLVGGSGSPTDYNLCTLRDLANRVISFAVVLSVFVATLMFAYGGILYVTAASGGEAQLKKAHGVFSSVFIGLVLVLIAWLIVNIVLSVLTGGGLTSWTNWFSSGSAGCSQIISQPFSQVADQTNSVQPTKTSTVMNAPTGSCVAASQANASLVSASSNCNPAQRVQNYGSGTSAITLLQKNYGTTINQCATEQGIPASALTAIAGIECGTAGASAGNCNDPAANGCTQGGYGISGVSCNEVRKYCSNSSSAVCSGVSSLNDTQLISTIQSNTNLSLCATAYTMKNNYNQYGDWANAAVVYNGGPGALAASSNCVGSAVMQCPIASASIQFPYCTITCAYHDAFQNYMNTASGSTGSDFKERFNAYMAAAASSINHE